MKWDHELLEAVADVAGMNPRWLEQRVRKILRKCPTLREQLTQGNGE